MTQFLVLAHGAGAVGMLVGTICGLPLAVIAILAVAVGRRRKRLWLISLSWWLSWFVLVWNVGWCVLILTKDGLPFQVYPNWYLSVNGVLEYLLFFGPAIFLSVCVIRISGRACRRPEIVWPAPARCAQCGYLLSGLTVARCPECGTPFDPALLKTERESVHK